MIPKVVYYTHENIDLNVKFNIPSQKIKNINSYFLMIMIQKNL